MPNHVAADHPWVTDRPQYLLAGREDDLLLHPEAFMNIAGGVYAKGRDPYFEPWQDVLQLNAFSTGLRQAAAETIASIGAQCDGVRCDMAMLMTNNVFARTWGDRAGPAPDSDYWPSLIARAKETYPDFLFLAEVYWDMESTLPQQGFDLCYDKRLYDRLAHDTPDSVRGHLQADGAYQQRLIRFIENHDEPRAAHTFGPARGRAAAVVISTLQGARLYHHGQLQGAQTHLPIQLGRGPEEPPDHDLRTFYRRLLRAAAGARAQSSDWRLCDCTGCSKGPHPQLIAWGWSNSQARYLVVVNLSPADADGRARLPWRDLAGRTWSFADQLSQERFKCSGDELANEGLRVTLDGWGYQFLAIET